MVHQRAVVHREVRETASAQADLGWLSESLWTRIEAIKSGIPGRRECVGGKARWCWKR